MPKVERYFYKNKRKTLKNNDFIENKKEKSY